MSDTLTIIGPIAETTLKFINMNRYKVFGYRAFVTEKIGKPCVTITNNLKHPLMLVVV